MPTHVNSPQLILSNGRGDSFDISLLSASILLGLGYDCYVVCGTAYKDLTT